MARQPIIDPYVAAVRLAARLQNLSLAEMKALAVNQGDREALEALRDDITKLLTDPIVAKPHPSGDAPTLGGA